MANIITPPTPPTADQLLPVVNQTDALVSFFGATVNQVFTPGVSQSVDGYVGQRPLYNNPLTDFYINEPTDARSAYQLEPGMVSFDANGNITNSLTYPDFVSYMQNIGAVVNNQSRMFENQYWCWSPPIDIDKILNFDQYYWFGFDSTFATQPVLKITSPVLQFTGDGETVSFAVPSPIDGVATNLQSYGLFVNGVSASFTTAVVNGNTMIIAASAPPSGSMVVTTNYDNMFRVYSGQVSGTLEGLLSYSAQYSGDGFTQSFAGFSGGSKNNSILVPYINGALVSPSDYTVSNGSVEFAVAPLAATSTTSADVVTIVTLNGLMAILEANSPTVPTGLVSTAVSNMSSGMLVHFVDTLSNYQNGLQETFIVDGVGRSIVLTNTNTLIGVSNGQFVTIDRSSTDQNGWSLRNLWVHGNTFAWSGLDLNQYKATRPIIEFVANTKLWNRGVNRLPPANAVLSSFNAKHVSGGQSTPISFAQINNLPAGSVTVDNGVVLVAGQILLVAQGIDQLNAIYRVTAPNGLLNLEVLYAPLLSGDQALVAGDYLAVTPAAVGNQVFNSVFGPSGTEVYFNGTFFVAGQQWNENVDPLFELFDVSGRSLADATAYPSSNFAGSRIFGFAEGSGTNDTVLLRPLEYDNNGYIVYQNDCATISYTSVQNSVVTNISGLYCYGLITDATTLTPNGTSIGCTTNSLWNLSATQSSQTSGSSGFYSIPQNLQANPLSGDVSTISLSDWYQHFAELIGNQIGFSGQVYANNNYRDTLKNNSLAYEIVQNQAPMLKAMLLASVETFDFPAAVRYADQEYSNFRNKFIRKIVDLNNRGVVLETSPISLWVSTALNALKVNLNYSFPFALSGMGGGNYFIPPTPAFLGVLPPTMPCVVRDNTYAVPVYFIRGHDGSMTPLFGTLMWDADVSEYGNTSDFADQGGKAIAVNPIQEVNFLSDYSDVVSASNYQLMDIRDQALLALEMQIYNSILPAFVENAIIDVNQYLGGKYYTALDGYTLAEINTMLAPIFERWSQTGRFDYRTNGNYDQSNPFTWNYRGLQDRDGNLLPGNWRAIYRWYFDTEHPDTSPWEMLGLTDKPEWWDTTYNSEGFGYYGPRNTQMWHDLANGIIRYPSGAVTVARYVRPGLLHVLPVGDVMVNGVPTNDVFLLDPISARIVTTAPTYQFAFRNWQFGDGGPVETLWRNSPSYRYALVQLLFMMKPNTLIETCWDSQNYGYIGDQWVDFRTNQRPSSATDFVHGEVDPSSATGQRTVVIGVQQWIADYLTFSGKTSGILGVAVRNLDVRLLHRMAGFVTADGMTAVSDTFGVLPSENVQVALYNSPAFSTESYSGVIVEWTGTGYRVFGYDTTTPYFTVLPPNTASPKGVITLANTPEPTVYAWAPNSHYAIGVNVNYLGNVYNCVRSHLSTTVFEVAYWTLQGQMPAVAPRVTTYLTGLTAPVKVSYGTEFNSLQTVADFLLSYQRWLVSRGWLFTTTDPNTGAIRDWSLAVKEFLTWSQVNWTPGAFIALSPAAETLNFTSSFGTILNVEDPITGYFGLVDRSCQPISNRNARISRLDGEITLIATKADIFGAKLRLAEVEHILVFSNETIFNDAIYIPLFNMRQARLRLIGNTGSNWQGRMNAPGYVVTGNKLVPNFDRNVEDIRTMFDIEKTDRQEFLAYARHNIGYQARSYMENLLLSDTEQFEFFQGMIQAKGSPGVFESLLRSSRISAGSDLEFLEEWAIRVDRYGAPLNPRATMYLYDNDVRTDPQLISFVAIENASPVWVIAPSNDARWLDVPNQMFFPNLVNSATSLPNAGFVRLSEVQYTTMQASDLIDFFQTNYQNNVATLLAGERVWVYQTDTNTWDVQRIFDVGSQPNTVSLVETVTEDNTVVGSRLTFSLPLTLTQNDVGAMIVIDGSTFSTPDLVGIQTITAINLTGNWIEVGVYGTQGFNFVGTTSPEPHVRVFRSVRFASLAALNSSGYAWLAGDLVWIDNDGVGQSVYAFDGSQFNKVRSAPTKVSASSIVNTSVYAVGAQISGQQLVSDQPLIDDLVVVDPLQGLIPGAAGEEITYLLDTDPANYNNGSNGGFINPWGANQIGQVWWDLSAVRYLEPCTDTLGVTNARDIAELSYRSSNWATVAPNTSVNVYEWVQSTVDPYSWTTLSTTDQNGTYTGTVYNAASPSWVSETVYSPALGTTTTVYYFWVMGRTTTPNVPFRKLDCATVTSILTNPSAVGTPWIAPISNSALIVSGVSPFLNDTTSALMIELESGSEDVGHDEWMLINQNDAQSQPPDWLWRKIRDSLGAFQTDMTPLPAADLSAYRATGIYQGQNMFDVSNSNTNNGGILDARESFIGIINNILAREAITTTRQAGVERLRNPAYASTPISQYLIWSRPDYSFTIEAPPANQYQFTVYSANERNLLLTSDEFIAYVYAGTSVNVLIDGTNTANPFWSIWSLNPSAANVLLAGKPANTSTKQYLYENGNAVFSLATAYDYSVAHYSDLEALIPTLAAGDRVYVESDETADGFWTIYTFGNTNEQVGSTAPVIQITDNFGALAGEQFVVTGTLTNYSLAPTLSYSDDSGAFVPLPSGAFVNTTVFSFVHPGMAVGGHTIAIVDQNGLLSPRASYVVGSVVLTSATLANVPTIANVGVAINGITATLTPTSATAYAALNNGSDVGARAAFTGTSVPSLIPPANGNYTVNVYAEATGGNAIVESSVISVTYLHATAATLNDVPTTATAGTAITGVETSLTPTNAQAYAVLNNGNGDVGVRTPFSGNNVPNLVPRAAGTFTLNIYGQATGGTALAVSAAITVSLPELSAATITNAPATGKVGIQISGLRATLTPSNAQAYACLRLNGTDVGSRVAFTGKSIPSFSPTTAGTYNVAVYAAITGGSPVAVSSNIVVTQGT